MTCHAPCEEGFYWEELLQSCAEAPNLVTVSFDLNQSAETILRCDDLRFNIANLEGQEDPNEQLPVWTLSLNDTTASSVIGFRLE